MSETWTIKTDNGGFNAYVAKPVGQGPWPAVVVIQEIFGVNHTMRQVADRLAADGFLAVAPDLFWRLEPGVDITDQTQAEWDRAFDLMNRFDLDKGVEDIADVIEFVRARPECSGKVGAVGYCLGGKLAFLTATRTDADASVSYYGVGLDAHLGETETLAQPLVLHIAEEDGFSSAEARERIVGALGNNPQVTIFTYPGRDHAFAREGGKNYDAADAALANGRTLDFLNKHLK